MTRDKSLSRRTFLKAILAAAGGVLASRPLAEYISGSSGKAFAIPDKIGYMHEARYYDRLDEKTVKCVLCPHECVLGDGQRSFCRVREPRDGKLYTLVYELVCAQHIDPIEKKPLYHVLPGSAAYSIATAGCNLRCKFCQNWQISQSTPEETRNETLTSERLVALAKQNNCSSIAYTYTEPTAFYEYVLDSARIAGKEGLKNISVTAGYINPSPLKEVCKYLDAANVDLKAYDDKYLQEICSERLDPLLEAIKIMRGQGVWVELTNLVVPTLNDDMGMIRKMSSWIRDNLGRDVPVHFSRFWPMYKLKDLPPTPVQTLEQARLAAMDEGLNYVYIGNIPNHEANNTYCPNCKSAVITRSGYYVTKENLSGSSCSRCGKEIAGIWK